MTMRTVTLYIAMSLDGMIADQSGAVGWLGGQEPGQDDMVSYTEFIKGIDTVVMGWKSYEQIATELSPDEWVYRGMQAYVVTHRKLQDEEEIRFTKEDVCSLVQRLKQDAGSGIWICGGASIAKQLMEADLIDRYHISVIPVILGGGIPLFGKMDRAIELRCVGTQTYNGITDLVYERR